MYLYVSILCVLVLSACSTTPDPYDGELVMPVGFPPYPESSAPPILLKPVSLRTFRSEMLGFSFEYPDLILVYEGVCGPFRDAQVPARVTEDPDNGKVYLAPSVVNDRPFNDDACRMVENTISRIKTGAQFTTWQMNILKDVRSEDELQNILRTTYGPGCALTERSVNDISGLTQYRVRLDDESTPIDSPLFQTCPVNWAVQVVYDPALGRAAFWDLGQEAKFWKDQAATQSYDLQMISSIRFF